MVNITETLAKQLAIEVLDIKGFTIYVINEGHWDPHYLVFKNEHHIHYADEDGMYDDFYASRGYDGSAVREMHIARLKGKLFTDDELRSPIRDYDDYEAKSYFLRSYYHMQRDYLSIFGNFDDKEFVESYKKKKRGLTYNPVSFCYMADVEFIRHQRELMDALEARKAEHNDNYEYYKHAFIREMDNHEYALSGDDLSVLSAFGAVSYNKQYRSLSEIFDDLGFTETQRKAYLDAIEVFSS